MISSQGPNFNNSNSFSSSGNSLMGTPFSVKDILNLAEQGGQFVPMMDSQQASFFFEDCGNGPSNMNTFSFTSIDTNSNGVIDPFAVTSGDFYNYHNNNKLADPYNNSCPDLVINSYHSHQQMAPSPVASLSQYSASPTSAINNAPAGASVGGIPPMTSPHVQQLSHLCPPFPDVCERNNEASLTARQDGGCNDMSAKGKCDERWEGRATEPAGEYTIFYGKGNENHELGAGFFCAQKNQNIVHLHPVAHCYFTFTFLSVFCAAYRRF
jgi:hypothetical protein